MKSKKQGDTKLFGTTEVAAILNIPTWRVKNFSEGEAYRLPPTVTVGKGRGSRRLYGYEDIVRVAIAVELVNCGFSPDAVGRAIREIPESLLKDRPRKTVLPKPQLQALVCHGGSWRVETGSKASSRARESAQGPRARFGVFVLPINGFREYVTESIVFFTTQVVEDEMSQTTWVRTRK